MLALAVAAGASHSAECTKGSYKIVLDVGHTALQPGAASARGATEFSFNLALAHAIAAKLKGDGFGKTDLLVTEGRGPAVLHSRPDHANREKADLFLSIHHDSVQPAYLQAWSVGGKTRFFSDRFAGFSLFVSEDNAHSDESLKFAALLADRLLAKGLTISKHHAEPIRGEGKPFLDEARGIYRYDKLVVLRETEAPAVLLEAGVIVNRAEELAAAAPARQVSIADAVAEAAAQFCQWQAERQ